MSKQEWLEYLDRKIGIEISRTNYSGLNQWVLMLACVGVFSVTVNEVISLFDDLTKLKWLILIVCISLNIMYVLANIIITFSDGKSAIKSKYVSISNTSIIAELKFYSVLCSCLVLLIIINIMALRVCDELLIIKWPYYYFTFIFLVSLIVYIRMYHKRKLFLKEQTIIPNLDIEFERYTKGSKKTSFAWKVIACTIQLIIVYFIMFSASISFSAREVASLIYLSVKVEVIICLVVVISFKSAQNETLGMLISFYDELFLEKYSETEIEYIFNKRFNEVNIFDWLQRMKELSDELSNELLELDQLRGDNRHTVNDNYSYLQRKERLEIWCNKYISELSVVLKSDYLEEHYKSECQKCLNEFIYIKDSCSS